MKALWSYEPFHQDTQRIKSMYQLLSQLVGDAKRVKIGFIATHYEPSLNLAFDVPESERFSTYPRAQILKELKAAKVNVRDADVRVVEQMSLSTTKVVDRMLKLANEQGCELIGLFTHARKGFARFVLGSFTETAIHRSTKDLLLMNPNANLGSTVGRILFASDFGSSSRKELSRVFQYAKSLGASLTVFHHAEVIYKWSMEESSPKVKAYRKSVDKMKHWVETEARKKGVSTNVIIASDFQSTAAHIFKVVKSKRIDVVVLSAKTGPMAALMGGSVTREVIRASSVPVLVIKTQGR